MLGLFTTWTASSQCVLHIEEVPIISLELIKTHPGLQLTLIEAKNRGAEEAWHCPDYCHCELTN